MSQTVFLIIGLLAGWGATAAFNSYQLRPTLELVRQKAFKSGVEEGREMAKMELNRKLRERGRRYPADPDAQPVRIRRAQIGAPRFTWRAPEK